MSELQCTNTFLCKVIVTWFEMKWKLEKCETIDQIMNQIIWYNSKIRISNKVIQINNLAKIGFIKIQDIIKVDGQFYSLDEVNQMCQNSGEGMIYWIHYLALCSAIPKDWIKKIRKDSN